MNHRCLIDIVSLFPMPKDQPDALQCVSQHVSWTVIPAVSVPISLQPFLKPAAEKGHVMDQ